MSTSSLCQQSQVHRLYSLYLHYGASHSAKHEDPECRAVLDQCFQLLERDYIVGRVDNRNGQLCSTYPAELAILEGERERIVQDSSKPRVGLEMASSRDHLEHAQSNSSARPGWPAATAEPALSSDRQQRQQHCPSSSQSQQGQQPQRHTSIPIARIGAQARAIQEPRSQPLSLDDPLSGDLDNSFDLEDTGMMSFQDIRAELDQVHQSSIDQALLTSQTKASSTNLGRRNILPFPFRIPPIKPDFHHATKSRTASPANVPLPQSPLLPHSTISRPVHDPSSAIVSTHKVNDTQELLRLFEKSHFARVRARFVVPCILVRGKNICRSGTLSNEVEVFMHNVNQKFNDLNQKRKTFLYGTEEKSPDKEDRESSLTKQRSEDIALLHRLGVTYINDLMVENRKVKYGLKVTSSEKVDSFGRYSSFRLVSTPYPGVEFFQKFKANKYSARKLRFDWSQTFADAELQLPTGHMDNLAIAWRDYKQWDLIELTQNYLRLYLTYIADGTCDPSSSPSSSSSDNLFSKSSYTNNTLSSKGLLIHCISGWDRTPLFISLLRISLWADGEIHSSLSAAELLYLTIGYDWFLFNHLLADRSSKGEDIFYFCFYFLKFLYSDEFSLKHITRIATRRDKTSRCDAVSAKPSTSPTGYSSVDEDVCVSCRCLSPSERQRLYGHSSCNGSEVGGGSSAPKNDAASSVDGKPSSWQFVSFAAGPSALMSSSTGKDSQQSPRYSPLRGNGGGTTSSIHFSSSSTMALSTSSTSRAESGHSLPPPPPPTATPSPSSSGSRLRAAFQHLGGGGGSYNRHSSSSYLPSHSPTQHPPTTNSSPALGGCEMLRAVTSPDPGTDLISSAHGGANSDVCDDSSSTLTSNCCRPKTTRKRATTFDGGLLIGSNAVSAVHGQDDDHDVSDEDNEGQGEEDEEDDDDLEDFTSGEEAEKAVSSKEALTRTHSADVPRRRSLVANPSGEPSPQYRDCRVCHLRFAVRASSRLESENSFSQGGSNNCTTATTVSASSARDIKEMTRHDQGNKIDREEGCSSFSSSPGRTRNSRYLRQSQSQQQLHADSDREEVFQLEIEDSRTNSHWRHDDIAQQKRLNSILSPTMDCKRKSLLDLLQANEHGEENENDDEEEGEGEREVDHGCRNGENNRIRGSMPPSFAHNELEWGRSATSSRDGIGGRARPSARRASVSSTGKGAGSGQGGSDVDDEEDDDCDDGIAGSLGSFQRGLELEQHQNDHMFLPSLQGVFASSEDLNEQTGPSPSSSSFSGRAPRMTHGGAGEGITGRDSSFGINSDRTADQHHRRASRSTRRTTESSFPADSEIRSSSFCRSSEPKQATRRQRLRELRRLFMEMRHEIGDGSRPPSRGGRQLLAAAAATTTSTVAATAGSNGGGHLDDSSDQMSPSGLTDDGSASSFPFGFDLHRHHHHQRQRSQDQHQYHHQAGLQQQHETTDETLVHQPSSSSHHHYMSSFFGSKSASASSSQRGPARACDAEGREAANFPPASGRRSPFEWAATTAASLSAGVTLHDSQHQQQLQQLQQSQLPPPPQQQQHQQQGQQGQHDVHHHHSSHRPSIPEVPVHLMLSNESSADLQSSSATAVEDGYHHLFRHLSNARIDGDDLSRAHHHRHHEDEEVEHDDPDPEPSYHNEEDSIDYSASFIESYDIPSSANYLRSERIFSSTLGAASSSSPLEHQHTQEGSKPLHHDQHHRHYSRQQRKDAALGSTTPPSPSSPSSPSSWHFDGSPSSLAPHGSIEQQHHDHHHRTQRPTATSTAVTAESSRSTPISAPLPKFRGATVRTGENGRLWDWMPGIFA